MRIFSNITQLIGNTPLVRLNRVTIDCLAEVVAKVEYFNPGGSAKDRVGLEMIEKAEKEGRIKETTLLIEPTSGNTGIGLALAAAVKGYKLLIVMPDNMSEERKKLIQAYGTKILLTPGEDGMKGAIAKAEAIHYENPDSYIFQQFDNIANPKAHKRTTGEEIWRDTEGKVDIFVAGVGTGGTITGVGELLKARNPNIRIVAVEPFSSPVLIRGEAGSHKIQGIGAGFIPSIFRYEVCDEIMQIRDQEAYAMTLRLAREEGLLVGISSGAAVCAAVEVAKRCDNIDKRVVVLLSDSGERYLSVEKLF